MTQEKSKKSEKQNKEEITENERRAKIIASFAIACSD